MKKCRKCQLLKPHGEFYSEKRNKDGLMGKCRGCTIVSNKEWIKNNREKWRAMHAKRQRKWRYKNIEKIRKNKRNWALELRSRIMSHYGKTCKCCGEANMDFLTLDHVNNDGAEQRRNSKLQGGGAIYYWVRKNNYPDSIQILCFNCNWSKHLIKNNNHCIHQAEKVEEYIKQNNI